MSRRRTRRVGRRRRRRRTAAPGRQATPVCGASPACPAHRSAPCGGGATLTPSATSVSRCSSGTCSWSKVSAWHRRGPAQRVEIDVRAEHHVGGHLSGGVVGAAASTRSAVPAQSPPDASSGPAGRRRSWSPRRIGALAASRASAARLMVSCPCMPRGRPVNRRDLHGYAAWAAQISVDCLLVSFIERRSRGFPRLSGQLRTAPRTDQVRDRRRDDVRHRLGDLLHTQADGSRAQAGHREDHRRRGRGDRVLHPQPRMVLQDRGGRERHHEALLFFGFSGVGVLIFMARCGSPATC